MLIQRLRMRRDTTMSMHRPVDGPGDGLAWLHWYANSLTANDEK